MRWYNFFLLLACALCPSLGQQVRGRVMGGFHDRRDLKYIPGVGYADPLSIVLLSSIPVLLLIGFGTLLLPIFSMIPIIIPAIAAQAGGGPVKRQKRESFLDQQTIDQIARILDAAIHHFRSN